MDTVYQNAGKAPITMANMPLSSDGLIDFRALTVDLVQDRMNAARSSA